MGSHPPKNRGFATSAVFNVFLTFNCSPNYINFAEENTHHLVLTSLERIKPAGAPCCHGNILIYTPGSHFIFSGNRLYMVRNASRIARRAMFHILLFLMMYERNRTPPRVNRFSAIHFTIFNDVRE